MECDPKHTNLVIVGAGTMGQGIATAAVVSGFSTVLVDISPDMLSAARDVVDRRVERVSRLDPSNRLKFGQLRLATDVTEAVKEANVVIEAVPEVETIKLELFKEMMLFASKAALLVTNTSTMSITKIAGDSERASRVIGMHFFNPAHRMKLVEIIVGTRSSDQTVKDAETLATALGKESILVKDTPGFVTSRLGLVLGTQAMRVVEDGVACVADVDKAMRLAYGHPMGPLELADLVGLDARLNNLRSMYDRTGSDLYLAPKLLVDLVGLGRTGRKSGAGFYRYDTSGKAVSSPRDPRL